MPIDPPEYRSTSRPSTPLTTKTATNAAATATGIDRRSSNILYRRPPRGGRGRFRFTLSVAVLVVLAFSVGFNVALTLLFSLHHGDGSGSSSVVQADLSFALKTLPGSDAEAEARARAGVATDEGRGSSIQAKVGGQEIKGVGGGASGGAVSRTELGATAPLARKGDGGGRGGSARSTVGGENSAGHGSKNSSHAAERSGGTILEFIRGAKAPPGQRKRAREGGGGGNVKMNEGRLSCSQYGGPSDEEAAEMVYWYDFPSDAQFKSPFKGQGEEEKFVTFEPDRTGWNNMRMGLETVLALAHAMGRTLVLPPKKRISHFDVLPGKPTTFSFSDFYDLEALGREHSGIDIISMEDFLRRQALAGKFVGNSTGRVSFPPNNRTVWDGESPGLDTALSTFLRDVAHNPNWNPFKCMTAFPARRENTESMRSLFQEAMKSGLPSLEQMESNPLPVDAPALDRMRELLLGRTLCPYDDNMREAPLVHFLLDYKKEIRLLIHFYAFLFFEDWRHDLHMKRLIRDHLRYRDELQCAAARVVAALRDRARMKEQKTNPGGQFDTLHVRRGDFSIQYKSVLLTAGDLFNRSRAELTPGSTIYVATDEKDRSYFKPFLDVYDVCFLDDFKSLLRGIDTNYYGIIDQLVASRGRVFFGTHLSTFSGHVNRLRGYHADKRKLKGYENGETESFYFFPTQNKLDMKRYMPVHGAGGGFWRREYPAAWRRINKGVER